VEHEVHAEVYSEGHGKFYDEGTAHQGRAGEVDEKVGDSRWRIGIGIGMIRMGLCS